MSVSICSKNLKNTIIDGQDTDIKCSTTQIEHKNVLFATFLVQTVCNCCGSWFIDNPHNIQPSDNASIFGSLPLSIIEISCKR